MTKRIKTVKSAAETLSDLNLFGAIIAVCEGSIFSSQSHAGAERLIKICKSETQKCLHRYDRNLETLARD